MFFFWLPAQHVVYFTVDYSWHTTISPPPPLRIQLFFFIIVFITEYCIDFYSFGLRSSHLISFLSHFVPALYSIIGSWCLPALHMVFLPWSRAGLILSPSYYFVLDFQFINKILHSLSFSFLSLFSCERSPVYHENTCLYFFYHRTSLSNECCTDYNTPIPPSRWLTPGY